MDLQEYIQKISFLSESYSWKLLLLHFPSEIIYHILQYYFDKFTHVENCLSIENIKCVHQYFELESKRFVKRIHPVINFIRNDYLKSLAPIPLYAIYFDGQPVGNEKYIKIFERSDLFTVGRELKTVEIDGEQYQRFEATLRSPIIDYIQTKNGYPQLAKIELVINDDYDYINQMVSTYNVISIAPIINRNFYIEMYHKLEILFYTDNLINSLYANKIIEHCVKTNSIQLLKDCIDTFGIDLLMPSFTSAIIWNLFGDNMDKIEPINPLYTNLIRFCLEHNNLAMITKYIKITNNLPRLDYNVLHQCSLPDNVELLQFFKDLGYLMGNDYINELSANNHLKLMDWWFTNGEDLYYSDDAMDLASGNGHIDVLEWWLNSGLELKYTSKAIDMACENGKLDVLKWWYDSGLYFTFTSDALDLASKNGHTDILQFWFESEMEIMYTENAIDEASKKHLRVLELWHKYVPDLQYSEAALSNAINYSRADIIDWWIKSGLYLKMTRSTSRHLGKKLKSRKDNRISTTAQVDWI
jgi:hypothetical protein